MKFATKPNPYQKIEFVVSTEFNYRKDTVYIFLNHVPFFQSNIPFENVFPKMKYITLLWTESGVPFLKKENWETLVFEILHKFSILYNYRRIEVVSDDKSKTAVFMAIVAGLLKITESPIEFAEKIHPITDKQKEYIIASLFPNSP